MRRVKVMGREKRNERRIGMGKVVIGNDGCWFLMIVVLENFVLIFKRGWGWCY